MSFLKVYQIYYKPEQHGSLCFEPFYNGCCTVFFENSVMRDLVLGNKHLHSKYFGVVSHNLNYKVEACQRVPRMFSHNKFSPKQFEDKLNVLMPDVMGFVKYQPHDPVSHHKRVHPKLPDLFKLLSDKIGLAYRPGDIEHTFYSNHYVCRSSIYDNYVKAVLIPAMDLMREMPEFMQDSGYPQKLSTALSIQWGINFYPYHSFVCERLFNYYVLENNLTCEYYS